MSEERTIREFFTQEVPSLLIPKDFFLCPNVSFLILFIF